MVPLPIRIEERLREEIERRGLILLDAGRRGQGGTSVIEVIVDSESGATLDELADLARWTSTLLDEVEGDLPGRYRLEVTTPGLDRPLEFLWQYRKNVGRLLKLLVDEDDGRQSTGFFRLLGVSDDAITVEPAPPGGRRPSHAKGSERTIPMSAIVRATVEPQL